MAGRELARNNHTGEWSERSHRPAAPATALASYGIKEDESSSMLWDGSVNHVGLVAIM